MQTQTNQRGHHEVYWTGRHLRLDHLKQEARDVENKYLLKDNIPVSPRPEVHVTRVKHDTDRRGLYGIWRAEGFRGSRKDALLWWSLSVSPDEITAAETRILRDAFPVRTEEQAAAQPAFLWKFTTSPAFLETSRLGSYRFTFPLQELLTAYSHQLCDGDQPVMRVYKTSLFKQEVMYAVLVHSPANQELFSEFPLLSDQTDAVCVYKDGHFIWRPEAMCETHSYELICRPDTNQMDVRQCGRAVFYVWDHVAIALHVESGQVLGFDADQLRENLTFCWPDDVKLIPPWKFDSFEEAKESVKSLWPGCRVPLQEECSLPQSFTVSDLRLVLVGRSGAGRSSYGNTILGRDAFMTETDQCILQSAHVFGWDVTIVNTPGLSETPAVRTEISRCTAMLAPGPHAFLLVLQVAPFTAEEQAAVRWVEKVFGEDVWRFTVVLCAAVDVQRLDIQRQLEEAGPELRSLQSKVGNRFLILNHHLNDDGQQVYDVLQAVATRVLANEGKVFSGL